MVTSQLIEARTRDGLVLSGVIFNSTRKRTIVVWVPGLSGSFSHSVLKKERLALSLQKRDIAFAVFDTRGSHVVTRLKVRKGASHRYITSGEAFERFTDCRHDLAAMVRTVKALGYRKVVLAGHSTGANKVAYYCSRPGHGAAAAIMLGPVSDIPGLHAQYGKKLSVILSLAHKMLKQSRGDELLPQTLVGTWFWSAARFISLATPGKPEDAFPYYGKRKFPWVKHWRLPLLVVQGGNDQYLDRPAKNLLRAFNEQCKGLKVYQSVLIPGADHSFNKHTAQLSHVLANWIRAHVPQR